jgi:hypothetical protein
MKKELQTTKNKEVQKYYDLLKQEDSKYDFESSNLANIEKEIVGLYKKKK